MMPGVVHCGPVKIEITQFPDGFRLTVNAAT